MSVNNHGNVHQVHAKVLPMSMASSARSAPGERPATSARASTAAKRPHRHSVCHSQTKLHRTLPEPQCLTIMLDEHDENIEEDLFIKVEEFIPKFDIDEKSPKQKYTEEFKLAALQLYFKYPFCYRVLQSGINFPRISTLYRLFIPKTTVLSPPLLDALKVKVKSMTPAEKQCAVCLATMKLRPRIQYVAKTGKITGFHEINNVHVSEAAGTALVVMVRGLFHDWKQAITFAYLSDVHSLMHTKLFINDIISKLFDIGLNVRVLISDMEADRVITTDEIKCSVQKPFIHIDNKKIYYMYDTLYLVKNMRDHMVKSNILYNDTFIAQWSHILDCYDRDHIKQLLRIAPKLSRVWLYPNMCQDDLKLAVDMFSDTTAAALSTYVQMGTLPPEATDTEHWILIMARLMEIINFSTLFPPENKTNVFSGIQAQIDYLNSMQSIFCKLRLLKLDPGEDLELTSKPQFMNGFRMTISAILQLHRELKTENYCYPLVGLSCDCLNLFFTEVYKKVGYTSPTTEQLTSYIKTIPIVNIFQYNNKKRGSDDLMEFLSHVRQMPDIHMFEEKRTKFVDLCAEDVTKFKATYGTVTFRYFWLYLLKKVHEKHRACEHMRRFDDVVKKNRSTTRCVSEKNSVIHDFVEYINKLLDTVDNYISNITVAPCMSDLLECIKPVTYSAPCTCYPLDYLKQLFLRLRLHLLLKRNNRAFDIDGRAHFTITKI